jgi:hypothetical protein
MGFRIILVLGNLWEDHATYNLRPSSQADQSGSPLQSQLAWSIVITKSHRFCRRLQCPKPMEINSTDLYDHYEDYIGDSD